MNCKHCGQPLEEKPGGHRKKEFCSDAHRVAYWRAQQQQDQDAALQSELADLRAKVRDQAQEIAELEQENTRLTSQLDFERRFLQDTSAHPFKAWLKKQPRSDVATKLLADQLLPPQGSRGLYMAHVRRLAPDAVNEFERLWKLMLLSQS